MVSGEKDQQRGLEIKLLAVMGGIMFYCSSLYCLFLSKPYPGHEWELALTRAAERGELDDPNIEEKVQENKLIKVTFKLSDFSHLEHSCAFSRHKNDLIVPVHMMGFCTIIDAIHPFPESIVGEKLAYH